jgi:hypothetical protein
MTLSNLDNQLRERHRLLPIEKAAVLPDWVEK